MTTSDSAATTTTTTTNETTVGARETVERLLRAAVGPHPGDMADCYAPSVVIEMPFSPAPLFPTRIETTREELRARYEAGTAVRRYTGLDRAVIHETTDPEVVIADYVLRGELVDGGQDDGGVFSLSFLMIITVREGRIVHSRDFSDPIAGARVLGRMPELLAALSSPSVAPSSAGGA